MTQIYTYGRLGGDPQRRQTKTGVTIAAASLAADIGAARDDEPASPLWLGVVAFGSAAEELLRHRKGDLLSIGGRLQLNKWTDQQGVEHERLQAVVQQVASARTVSPGGGKKRTGALATADTPTAASPAPATRQPSRFDHLEITDDDVPF